MNFDTWERVNFTILLLICCLGMIMMYLSLTSAIY